MSKSSPRRARSVGLQRNVYFHLPGGKPVVLTLCVPRPIGSDWGCAVQITGLKTTWRRPRYVFGVDGLQALHLAMKCVGADLEAANVELQWLGQMDDLGLPKFLPDLPRPQQQRLEAMVEAEAARLWAHVQRGSRVKRSAKHKKSTHRRATK